MKALELYPPRTGADKPTVIVECDERAVKLDHAQVEAVKQGISESLAEGPQGHPLMQPLPEDVKPEKLNPPLKTEGGETIN